MLDLHVIVPAELGIDVNFHLAATIDRSRFCQTGMNQPEEEKQGDATERAGNERKSKRKSTD